LPTQQIRHFTLSNAFGSCGGSQCEITANALTQYAAGRFRLMLKRVASRRGVNSKVCQ
jgi:hypothetical protein